MTPQNKTEAMFSAARIVHIGRVKQARDESIPQRELDYLSETYKALGDPTRLKILMALLGGEMCVCDIAAFLGLSESAVSHQLRRLKDIGLVRNNREGRIYFYSLDDSHVADLLKVGLEHIRE